MLPSLYIYCDPLCHQNILHVLALLFPSKYFKIFQNISTELETKYLISDWRMAHNESDYRTKKSL